MEFPNTSAPVAVAIPCFNEEAAAAGVVLECRAAFPEAEVWVFDNGSTDRTAEVAAAAGARVVPVPERGKGHAVRAALRRLADRPAVLMLDGDGTYPPEALRPLLEAVLRGEVDMGVVARQSEATPGAMSPVRGLGNVLIRGAFRVLIGRGSSDPLSGARAFGPRMLREVAPGLAASGFEIEVELEAAALRHGLRTRSAPGPYRPRVEGTRSKLVPWRDGWRILREIAARSRWRRAA